MKSIIDTVISEETGRLFEASGISYTWPIEYFWVKGTLISVDLLESVPADAVIAPSQNLMVKWFAKYSGIYLTPKPSGQYQIETRNRQIISSESWGEYEETVENGLKYIIQNYGQIK